MAQTDGIPPFGRGDYATLRLRFERSWSVAEVSYLFRVLASAYRQNLLLDLDMATSGTWLSGDGRRPLSEEEAKLLNLYLVGQPIFSIEGPMRENHVFLLLGMADLQVREIKVASPGFSDLAGIGRAIEGVVHLIEKIINIRLDAAEKRLGLEERRERIRGMEIENHRSKAALLKDLGYDNDQVRAIINQDINAGILIDELKERGKLGRIEIR